MAGRYFLSALCLTLVAGCAESVPQPPALAGKQLLQNGDWDASIPQLTKAIEADPQDFQSYRLRGYAYHARRDMEKAIADYSQAIRIAPKHPEAYYLRAIAYRETGDLAKADADDRLARKLDPAYAQAYLYKPKTEETSGPSANSATTSSTGVTEPDATVKSASQVSDPFDRDPFDIDLTQSRPKDRETKSARALRDPLAKLGSRDQNNPGQAAPETLSNTEQLLHMNAPAQGQPKKANSPSAKVPQLTAYPWAEPLNLDGFEANLPGTDSASDISDPNARDANPHRRTAMSSSSRDPNARDGRYRVAAPMSHGERQTINAGRALSTGTYPSAAPTSAGGQISAGAVSGLSAPVANPFPQAGPKTTGLNSTPPMFSPQQVRGYVPYSSAPYSSVPYSSSYGPLPLAGQGAVGDGPYNPR